MPLGFTGGQKKKTACRSNISPHNLQQLLLDDGNCWLFLEAECHFDKEGTTIAVNVSINVSFFYLCDLYIVYNRIQYAHNVKISKTTKRNIFSKLEAKQRYNAEKNLIKTEKKTLKNCPRKIKVLCCIVKKLADQICKQNAHSTAQPTRSTQTLTHNQKVISVAENIITHGKNKKTKRKLQGE